MATNRTTGGDEEFQVPPITVSPITGMQGAVNWGGLNKFNIASRHVISDVEADELINWLPQMSALQQVPSPSAVIGTLPGGAVIWAYTDILNGNLYTFILATNTHIYQMSTTGTFTDLGSGFSSSCDIANWEGTLMMITDPVAQKIYSWNGTTLTTVFSSQPAEHIAVYSARVWLSHNLTLTWTNANTYNSLGGDSGTFTITDGRCANPIVGMRDFNGSLYVFGSNWIKTVYGLQPLTVSGVTTLSFQQPTLESQIGPISKWSVVEYGGMLFFANVFGFWSLSGAFPTKISNALDGFFENLDLPNCSWSASYGTVHQMPCILFNVRWSIDGNYTVFGYTINQQWFRVIPVTGSSGPGIAKWICGSCSSAVTNNRPITYYSDGTNFYDLFGGSAVVTSQFNTKIWDFYSKLSVDWFTNAALQLLVTQPTTLTVCEINPAGAICGPAQPAACTTTNYTVSVGDWYNSANQIGQWVNSAGVAGDWQSSLTYVFILAQYVVPFQERGLGLNITVTSKNAVFQAIVISYRKMMQAKG
jgi:hypothetical protein